MDAPQAARLTVARFIPWRIAKWNPHNYAAFDYPHFSQKVR
jgi:hypothetical protein